MSDLVTKLRHHKAGRFEPGVNERLMDEAADEIERRVRMFDDAIDLVTERDAEIKRLREGLESLLPGLELDLRYANPHVDDMDALRSRVATVREALSAPERQEVRP
jgi:hypothetical protein